jgi:hypothetical protein
MSPDARRKEAFIMQWDLGIQGIGLLLVMSLGFGLVAHLALAGRTTNWMGVIASAAFFVVGLISSEVWFGWATVEELQPNIDGLSFDEALMAGLVAGILAVVGTWLLTRRGRRVEGPTSV